MQFTWSKIADKMEENCLENKNENKKCLTIEKKIFLLLSFWNFENLEVLKFWSEWRHLKIQVFICLAFILLINYSSFVYLAV